MFDFVRDEAGSEDRYRERSRAWEEGRTTGFGDGPPSGYVKPDGPGPVPRIRHYGWWVLHNCVAHPLIGLVPLKFSFDFHDWTSAKLNGN